MLMAVGRKGLELECSAMSSSRDPRFLKRSGERGSTLLLRAVCSWLGLHMQFKD